MKGRRQAGVELSCPLAYSNLGIYAGPGPRSFATHANSPHATLPTKPRRKDIADIARLPAVFRPDISSGAERSSRSTLLIGDGFLRRIERSPCDLRRELKEFERNTYIRLVASKKLEILVFRGGRHFLG